MTPAQKMIYDLLKENKEGMTVQQILQQLKVCSRTTVFRAFKLFSNQGILFSTQTNKKEQKVYRIEGGEATNEEE